MNPRSVKGRWLEAEEVRTVADLRIMHSKVGELWQICHALRERHDESDIVAYADVKVLADDIRKVDELYLWFVSLKEEAEGRRKRRSGE